jgi:hypothetical protein
VRIPDGTQEKGERSLGSRESLAQKGGAVPEVGTLDDLKNYMMGVITDIGENFTAPDDDWLMVGAFEDSAGRLNIAPLPNEAFATEDSKDRLAGMIKAFIGKAGIVNYVILFNVHGVAYKTKEEMKQALEDRAKDGKRLSTLPGAFEMLMMVVGNAGYETTYQAEITRDGENPPTLGEWKEIPETKGRFAKFNEFMKPIEI